MAKNLVIVESPAKAKTLKKFLGSNYKIEASMGHIRDLPKSDLGINVEEDFEPRYITIRGKGELLKKLRKEVKKADKIYLATDPDREGEAISWHLIHALKLQDKKYYRITFNEITKQAVKNSIKEARDIDMDLVDAQQARRALDRLVGYNISPLLWKKVKKGLSGGRVQSVTLKIICDREEEIAHFEPEEYWTIDYKLKKGRKIIDAKFYGKDKKIDLKDEKQVKKILKETKNKDYIVDEVKKSKRTKKPSPPFTTSTLQQEASKQLGFATNKAMLIAQQLYEGVEIKGEGTVGLVSYIRTDSVRVSDEVYEETKNYISQKFGEEYLPESRNIYKSKGKAQDAHECIRPTSVERDEESIKESLSKDQYKLYKLIRSRFLASQMANAIFDTQSAKIVVGDYKISTSGSILKFDGYKKVLSKKAEDDEEIKIPELEVGETLTCSEIEDKQHFTQPPARYTEANLVKTLEDLGVGRPSTYAPTISTIVSRGYVTKEQKTLYPTELGEIVNDLLESNFDEVIDVNFTAGMENLLDKVGEGNYEWKQILRDFYPAFKTKLEEVEEKVSKIEIKDEVTDVICSECGKNMVIKYGKYGKFLACPGFPDCRNTKPLLEDAGTSCPICNGTVYIKKTKKGRKYFGCEHNPECDFISWYKPIEEKCPKCESYLVIKGNKTKKVACSNEQCDFIREYNDEDEKNEE